jgi:monofunctional biosynthetic peptidoglycan transglycosylase
VLLLSQGAYLALLSVVNPPLTLTQLSALAEMKRLKRDYVALGDISDHVRLAVIAAEDQRFASHDGFDWQSVRATLRDHEKRRRRLRGASTLSQQVAKNVFLWQHRSWVRKGLEAYFTVLLELTLDKRRILELYLNVAEMGPGIFGIEAAAIHYFDKPARALTRREAALIAACLPNPKVYHADNPSRRIRAKAEWILGQMKLLSTSRTIQGLLH